MVNEHDIKDMYPDSEANKKQYGGTHYKQFKGFEPWDVITQWGLGYLDGTALKYIARWKHKNGLEDLKKAIHFLEKAVEVETAKAKQKEQEHVSKPPDYLAFRSVWDYADSFSPPRKEVASSSSHPFPLL